jgi:hypothetical protein
MSENLDHLNDSTRAILDLPQAERIEYIRSPRWIGYSRAKQIQAKLEDLLTYPKSHRMPNLLIVGDTNNGKTMLVQRFRSLHPATERDDNGGSIVPVLDIQAPPLPDEARFYGTILDRLFSPYSSSGRVERRQAQTIRLLHYVGLKMLIVDEIHHVLAGNLNKQRAFLNVIKYLGNELQVPIVAVGTRDAFQALHSDPQLANRFEPVLLPRWEMNEDFLRLLVSFERMIPLKKASVLPSPKLAARILSLTEGHIGEMSLLLTKAAIAAVESGEEKITLGGLDQVDWISPSGRKRQVELMN